jgi:ribonuclease T1
VFLSRLLSPKQSPEKLALAIALVVVLSLGGGASAKEAGSALPTVALAALPAEAQQTEQQIRNGGPFVYAKDGVVFGNRERILPANTRGYYREYTVPTPGARNRGARRIVCGGRQPAAPQTCYYTSDHYATFARIVP